MECLVYESRSYDMLLRCYDQVCKLRFFVNMEKSLVLNILKEVALEQHQHRAQLFTIGDVGKKFFIILKGGVNIMVPGQNGSQLVINSELREGDTFGEIAIRTDGIRTSSAYCVGDTTLLVLNSSQYQRILQSYHDQLYNDKIDFLREFSFFSKWSVAALHTMMYYLRCLNGKRGEILYKQGDDPTYIYFLKSGEVEISSSITVEEKELTDTQQKVNDLLRPVHRLRNRKTVHQGLWLLKSGEMFGEDEIFEKRQRKFQAMIYSSKAEIYFIHQDHFFHNMANHVKIEEMRRTHLMKEAWHRKLIKHKSDSPEKLVSSSDIHIPKIVNRTQKEREMLKIDDVIKNSQSRKLKIFLQSKFRNLPVQQNVPLEEPKKKNYINQEFQLKLFQELNDRSLYRQKDSPTKKKSGFSSKDFSVASQGAVLTVSNINFRRHISSPEIEISQFNSLTKSPSRTQSFVLQIKNNVRQRLQSHKNLKPLIIV